MTVSVGGGSAKSFISITSRQTRIAMIRRLASWLGYRLVRFGSAWETRLLASVEWDSIPGPALIQDADGQWHMAYTVETPHATSGTR